MNLVYSLDERRVKEVVDALEDLLALARAGELRGMQYTAELRGMIRPMMGITGTYKRDINHALSALTQAKATLLDKLEAPRGFSESR